MRSRPLTLVAPTGGTAIFWFMGTCLFCKMWPNRKCLSFGTTHTDTQTNRKWGTKCWNANDQAPSTRRWERRETQTFRWWDRTRTRHREFDLSRGIEWIMITQVTHWGKWIFIGDTHCLIKWEKPLGRIFNVTVANILLIVASSFILEQYRIDFK